MRKDREQQKKEVYKQLNLFIDTPCGQTDGSTERTVRHGVELSSRLENKRTLTTHALDAIVRYENLTRAYQQVKRNGGSSGVDGMSVSELSVWLGEDMDGFRRSILEEQYQVDPVRQKDIRKPDGGTRMLGIPTVKDRMIQQAISQKLMIYYDPGFSESSFGFRPGKSAHQAVEQSARYIQSGREWVVDIDLEKFFDKIKHDRLMQ